MSKLACHCGDVISDSHYPSKTEGELRTQTDFENFEDLINKKTNDYVNAVCAGNRECWMRDFFGEHYPAKNSDGEVIADIRSFYESDFLLSVCECKSCGRIYIQKKSGLNEYLCYEPREKKYEAILDKKADSQLGGGTQSAR